MFLLDTNVVSELGKPRPSPAVMAWINAQDPRRLFTCAIVKTEIEYGLFIAPDGKKKRDVAAATSRFFSLLKGRCLPFDENTSAHCAMIRSARKSAGTPIGITDAMIAATARQHGLSVATRNAADFSGIAGLAVVDPWR